jgi:hypothetical protein
VVPTGERCGPQILKTTRPPLLLGCLLSLASLQLLCNFIRQSIEPRDLVLVSAAFGQPVSERGFAHTAEGQRQLSKEEVTWRGDTKKGRSEE